MKFLLRFLPVLLLLATDAKAQSTTFWNVHIGTDSREALFQKTGIYKGIPLADSLQDRHSFSGTFAGQPATMVFDIAQAVYWKSNGPDLVYAGYANFDCKDWDAATTAAWVYKLYASEKRVLGRNCDRCTLSYSPESLAKEIRANEEFHLEWKDTTGFLRDIRYLPQKQVVVLGYHYVEIKAIINLFQNPTDLQR